MRSWFSSRPDTPDRKGNPDSQEHPTHAAYPTPAPIERLENRRLLSTVDAGAELQQSTLPTAMMVRQRMTEDNPAALPNLLGIHRGTIGVDEAFGISPGSRLDLILEIPMQTVGGRLAGTLAIGDAGAFETFRFTGIITGRRVNLSFTDGDGGQGVLSGRVFRNGQLMRGDAFAQLDDTFIRGDFRVTKRSAFPIFDQDLFDDDFNGLFDSFLIRSPGFFFGDGIGLGAGAGFGRDIVILPDGSFGFSTTPPSFGFSPVDTGFGTRPITRPVSGFVPISSRDGFSAGAVLDRPFSVGSVLDRPFSAGSVLQRPGLFDTAFSTTPITATGFGR